MRLTGAAGETLDVPFDFGPNATPPAPKTVTPGFAVTGHSVDPDAACLVWEAGVAVAAVPHVEPWRAIPSSPP